MSHIQLTDILARLKADDDSALKELFHQHYQRVCQTMHRFIRDKNLVEDLAQNVFIRFWEKRHQINVTTSVGAYFHRMAINEALAYLRKTKNKETEEITAQTPTDSLESVETGYLQSELKSEIIKAIDTLPPRCRTVFQLSRFEELTYKEIAVKMEISVKTVENQMGKALRVLREELKGYLRE